MDEKKVYSSRFVKMAAGQSVNIKVGETMIHLTRIRAKDGRTSTRFASVGEIEVELPDGKTIFINSDTKKEEVCPNS